MSILKHLFIALLLTLAMATPSMAVWPATQRVGCWQTFEVGNPVPTSEAVFRLTATLESSGIYRIHGKWTFPLTDEVLTPRALTGTAVKTGTDIFISMNSVYLGFDNWEKTYNSSSEHIELLVDKATLVGTFYSGTQNYGSRWENHQVRPVKCR